MKTITINEYLKFQNQPVLPEFDHAYRDGYWNVFRHTEVLERFLIKHNIDHYIIED